MKPEDAILLVVIFMAALALGDLALRVILAGSPRHRDARRRADLPDPWWQYDWRSDPNEWTRPRQEQPR